MKYSAQFNNENMMKIAALFEGAKEGMTAGEIAVALGGQITTQKVVRLIGDLNAMMPVIRQKGKNGLMHYKSKAVHEAQGYDTSFYTGKNNEAKFEPTYFNPGEKGWVAPTFRYLYPDNDDE